jgi:hypothetical protein
MDSLPSGFSLNMGAFISPRHTSIEEGKLELGVTQKVRIPIFIRSDYRLGYLFGAFLSCGIANLTDYKKSRRGITVFKPKIGYKYNYDKLESYFKEVFNLKPRIKDRFLYVYNVPVTKMFKEFGIKKGRHLPKKYRVNNNDFNSGILDGLHDFHAFEPDDKHVSWNKKVIIFFLKELYKELKIYTTVI